MWLLYCPWMLQKPYFEIFFSFGSEYLEKTEESKKRSPEIVMPETKVKSCLVPIHFSKII